LGGESFSYINVVEWCSIPTNNSTHLKVTLKFNDGDPDVTVLLGSGHSMLVEIEKDEEETTT